LREVDDDGDVAALAREARAPAVGEDRRPVLAADRDGLDDVVGRLRDHDPDRELPVVRAAGRVERAVAGTEADLALDRPLELALELRLVELEPCPRRGSVADVRLGRDLTQPAGPPAAGTVRLRRSAGAAEVQEVAGADGVFARRDVEPARGAVPHEPQAVEVGRADRLLEPRHAPLALEALGPAERLLPRQ